MKSLRWMALLLATGLALPLAAQAQVVREDGAKSIAGVLVPTGVPGMPAQAEWTFKSVGGEILFASLDADVYRVPPQGSEHTATAAAETGGGCGGEDEGGPGLFKLKVLDSFGQVLCEASRPAPPPGWQRDARLACVLPAMRAQATYTVRVVLGNPEGELLQPAYPFLLNISLRKIAPSGTNIQSAIATSSTGGF